MIILIHIWAKAQVNTNLNYHGLKPVVIDKQRVNGL